MNELTFSLRDLYPNISTTQEETSQKANPDAEDQTQGRNTQGVKLIELQKRNDTLMSGCIVPKEEEEMEPVNTEDIATESSEEEA